MLAAGDLISFEQLGVCLLLASLIAVALSTVVSSWLAVGLYGLVLVFANGLFFVDFYGQRIKPSVFWMCVGMNAAGALVMAACLWLGRVSSRYGWREWFWSPVDCDRERRGFSVVTDDESSCREVGRKRVSQSGRSARPPGTDKP